MKRPLPTRVRPLAALAVWLVPLLALALTFCAERVMGSRDSRFAILPATSQIDRALQPALVGLDQAIVGYLLMALAAVVFAVTLKSAVFHSAPGPKEGDCPALGLSLPSRPTAAALAVAALVWSFLLWRVSDQAHEWFYLVLLLAAAAIPCGLLLRRDLRHGVSFRVNVAIWEVAALGALLTACGILLTFDLAHTPDSMWGDEGNFWSAAKAVGQGTQAADFFAPGVYSFPLASSIYQAAFLKLFGYDVWSWRFSSVFSILAAAVPMYFLARAMFDRTVAFASVALMVTSPFLLAFGRTGYNNVQALFPVVLSLLLLYAAVERKSALLFFASGLAAGLGFYTYYAARVVVVIIAMFVAHGWLTKRLALKEAAIGLALAAAATIMVGVLPTVNLLSRQEAALQAKMVEGVFANAFYVETAFRNAPIDTYHTITLSDIKLIINFEMWVRLLGRGVLRTLLAFHRDDMVDYHYISGSLGGPTVSALLLPAIAVSVRRIAQPGPALLLIWASMAVILLSVLATFPPTYPHLVTLIPALAIGYAAVLSITARSMTNVARAPWRAAASAGLVALAVVFFATLGAREYFGNTNHLFPPTLDIALWFEAEDLKPGEHEVLVYENQVYDDYIPWGVDAFDLKERFTSQHVSLLDQPAQVAELRSAAVVFVDAQEENAVVPAVIEALPGWRFSTRNAPAGEHIFWVFLPPD